MIDNSRLPFLMRKRRKESVLFSYIFWEAERCSCEITAALQIERIFDYPNQRV